MSAAGCGSRPDAEAVTQQVLQVLAHIKQTDSHYLPSVEGIQNIVEEQLMLSFPTVAKHYILYREQHARNRQSNIFEKRLNLKPYEYPALLEYIDAIRHSYWIHSEFNFTADIQDFKTQLTAHEREAIKRTMLAISQIEVAVKSFWGNIYHKMPKPEIGLYRRHLLRIRSAPPRCLFPPAGNSRFK